VKLFGFSRKADDDATIYGARIRVKAGHEPLPSPFIGAYVIGFLLCNEPREAVTTIVRALQEMGYDIEEIDSPGFSVPLGNWEKLVADTWPHLKDQFPSQSEIGDRLAKGVVFSPFMGFVAP
jgi:hypothetical protein